MKLFLEIFEIVKDPKSMGGESPSMLRVEITDDEDGRKKLAELQADVANKIIFGGDHVIRVHECREGAPCSVRDLAKEGIISTNSDSTPDETSARLDSLEQSLIAMYAKQNEAAKVLDISPAVVSDYIVSKMPESKIDISKV